MRVTASVFGTDFRSILTSLFIVSVLYGDVWLGITVPVSMLFLPFLFLASRKGLRFSSLPLGCAVLLGMALPVAFQYALGQPLRGKSDAVVYLPVVYAVATMFVLQLTMLPQNLVWRALVTGGIVTAAVMLVMMGFFPRGVFLLPGQDFYATHVKYERSIIERWRAQQSKDAFGRASSEGPRLPTMTAAELGEENSQFENGLYSAKRSIKNALGTSNYISAFFVFLFTVSLFHQRWPTATLFAALTLLTLSRLSVLFLGFAILLWLLDRRGFSPTRLAVAVLTSGGVALLTVLLISREAPWVLPISATNRSSAWSTAVDIIAKHPLLGAPRSQFLEEFNLDIIWSPHNVLLWIAAIAGLLGLTFYLLYLFVALSEIRRTIPRSSVWTGVFFGFVVLLTWSLLEPIAMTPAFEVLFAALYMLARNDQASLGPAPSQSPASVAHA